MVSVVSLAAPEAHAQMASPAGAAQVAEVVVTARQRSESLMSVPVAVTALSAQELARQGATDLKSISTLMPGVTIAQSGSGNGGTINIRGIGTSPSNVGFEQAASVNIDGVQVSRGRAVISSYLDLQQVEVLKGPQALFFGKNSPAGVVSLTSKDPTNTLEGYAKAGYELNAQEGMGEFAVSNRLTDTLGFRLAVRAREMRGWMMNEAQPLVNPFVGGGAQTGQILGGSPDKYHGDKEVTGRLTLKWAPVENFTATLKSNISVYRSNGSVAQTQIIGCGTATGGNIYGFIDPNEDCKADNRFSVGDLRPEVARTYQYGNDTGKPYEHMVSDLSSLTLNYVAGPLNMTAITGYYDYAIQYMGNFDYTGYDIIGATERDAYTQLSEQVRVYSSFHSPLNFMLGGYIESSALRYGKTLRFLDRGIDPATGKYQTLDTGGRTGARTYSVFGQLIYNVTDTLEAAGGVRWTREEKDSINQNRYVHPAFTTAYDLTPFTDNFRGENLSPEATLTWRPTSTRTIYAAYKTGYKSGGMGLSLIPSKTTLLSDMTFRPERAKGFEVGAKGAFLDRRLQITGDVYRYTYDNLQVNAYNAANNSFTIKNAAGAIIKGVEAEARYLVSEDLSLHGSVNYNKARYTDFISQCYNAQTFALGCNVDPLTKVPVTTPVAGKIYTQNLAGRPTVSAPDWTGTLGAVYTHPVSDKLSFEVNGDLYYSSGYFASATENPNSHQKSYVRVNAGVRLFQPGGPWEFAIIGRNLTNEFYLVTATDKPGDTPAKGQTSGVIGRTREVIAQVNYRF
ncbi:MAG: TonB-dependent receptor [Phenylobacterium sp.]|nr:TonB-dependent receptor [Phenylobacterium sp.]